MTLINQPSADVVDSFLYATFYVWIGGPEGHTSEGLCELLLEKASIVTTPGNGFGPSGNGYIRAALTVSEERIKAAVERIRGLKI